MEGHIGFGVSLNL